MTPAYVRKLARRLGCTVGANQDCPGQFCAEASERDGFAFAWAYADTRAKAWARLGRKLATALRRRVRLDTKALAATAGRKGGGRW